MPRMHLSTIVLAIPLAIVSCLAVPLGAAAENATGSTEAPPAEKTLLTAAMPLPTIEQVQALRDKAAQSETLEAETKAKLLEVYDKTLAQLKILADLQAQRDDYIRRQQAAPAELEKAKNQLAVATAQPEPVVPSSATASELEAMLTTARATLDQAQKQRAALADEPKRRLDRRAEIPVEVTAAKEGQAQAEQRLDVLQAAQQTLSNPSALDQANLALARVEQAVAQTRVIVLEEELKAYDATGELLTLRRDLAARSVAAAEKYVKLLETALAETRRLEIEREQEKARQAVRQARYQHPLIQTAAQENARLAGIQAQMLSQIEKTRTEAEATDAAYKQITTQFEKIKNQITTAGQVTDVLGVLLLAERDNLPDPKTLQEKIRRRVAEIGTARADYERYDQAWTTLTDPESQADALLGEAGPAADDPARTQIRAELVRLLNDRRGTLQTLSTYSLDYAGLLSTLDSKQRLLLRLVDDYARFIDERILWVRDAPALRPADMISGLDAVRWFIVPAHWGRTVAALAHDIPAHAVLWAVFVALWLAVAWPRRRLHDRLAAWRQRIEGRYTDRFIYTVQAALVTVRLFAPAPLALAFLAWRLARIDDPQPFAGALSLGLLHAAAALAVYGLIRGFCLPDGLGHHLGFQAKPLQTLRRHSAWFFALFIPLTAIAHVMPAVPDSRAWTTGLGRILFCVQDLVLLAFLALVLRPEGGLMQPYFEKRRDSWLGRLRFVWYALVILLAWAPAVLAALGYVYAARQLYTRFLETWLLIPAILFLQALCSRWLTVARKHLALRRQRLQKRTPADTSDTPSTDDERLSQQVVALVRAAAFLVFLLGGWWIWRSILPAFGALEQIPLWNSTDAGGRPVVISLGRVIAAVVILVMTIILARNAPGLLEILVLERLPLDRGARFAVVTMTRYLLVVVGVVLTFQKIGIGWAKVQWLIAAMTVGLGFGLQEIFANFVSGLIILFEQPVRVGDTVTVGDINGKVTRIRIRATTIRKWDQKELIVPNKEFITGRLINWSLSDRILRLDFPIGVAYGSDIRKTEQTLYRIARAHPLVVQTPPNAPRVVFQEFGDSALIFELRVYLTDMDNLLQARHEINCAIDDAFRKEGIEIAFPQHDLHIRSVQSPFVVRSEPADSSPREPAPPNP